LIISLLREGEMEEIMKVRIMYHCMQSNIHIFTEGIQLRRNLTPDIVCPPILPEKAGYTIIQNEG